MTTAAATGARTLDEVAAAIGGTVDGDGGVTVDRLVHPMEWSTPNELIMVMNAAFLAPAAAAGVRGAVLSSELQRPDGMAGAVLVDRPRFALAALIELFARPPYAPPGVHPTAVVEPSARLGNGVSIGAMAYVGPDAVIGAGSVLMPQSYVGAGAALGKGCLIHSGARVGERVVMGDRVIAHHNASIGTDGFSFVTPQESAHERAKGTGVDSVAESTAGLTRIGSVGTVIIGHDVEIGASAAVDRANVGATIVGSGTKIDNHVQIAHNCVIGENCLFSGQVALSGSVKVGDRVVLAGRVGIADHINIGDDAIIGAGSGVWRDVAAGQVMAGYPALPKTEALGREANIARLPRILRDLADIKRRLRFVEKAADGDAPAQSDPSGDA